MKRKRWPPARPGVIAGEVICGRTAAFTLAPGNPLRAASCVICGLAAGGQPVHLFSVFQFTRPAEKCGAMPAAAWLIHESHPTMPDERLAGIAIRKHHSCLEKNA